MLTRDKSVDRSDDRFDRHQGNYCWARMGWIPHVYQSLPSGTPRIVLPEQLVEPVGHGLYCVSKRSTYDPELKGINLHTISLYRCEGIIVKMNVWQV
jgi:hypothetical protein